VTSGHNNLSSNTNLTIIGLGGPREIRSSGTSLFGMGSAVSNASLTLGNGITLDGRMLGGTLVWIEGSSTNTFAMEDGSKITRSRNTGGGGPSMGAVFIGGGSTFYMRGGTITGNHASSGFPGEVAGVLVEGSGSRLDQTGGSITGNTSVTGVYPNVRLTDGATRTGIGGTGNS